MVEDADYGKTVHGLQNRQLREKALSSDRFPLTLGSPLATAVSLGPGRKNRAETALCQANPHRREAARRQEDREGGHAAGSSAGWEQSEADSKGPRQRPGSAQGCSSPSRDKGVPALAQLWGCVQAGSGPGTPQPNGAGQGSTVLRDPTNCVARDEVQFPTAPAVLVSSSSTFKTFACFT